jgi:hypothetical protein
VHVDYRFEGFVERVAPSRRYSGERAGERGFGGHIATLSASPDAAPKILSPALSREYAGEKERQRPAEQDAPRASSFRLR